MPEEQTPAQADNTNAVTTQDGTVAEQPKQTSADVLYNNKEAEAAPADETPKADAEEKPAEAETPKSDDNAEFDLTAPEGFEITPELKGELAEILTAEGTPQERAQKLVDMHARLMTEQMESQQGAYTEMQDKWLADVKADKEIGGARLEQNISVAVKAVDRFGGNDLKELLNETGLGNHPAVVKAFLKIGKEIGEGPVVTGAASGKPAQAKDVLYN